MFVHGSRRINRRDRAQGSVCHPYVNWGKVVAPPLEETEPMAFNETAFRRRGPLLKLSSGGITAQAYFELFDLFLAKAVGP